MRLGKTSSIEDIKIFARFEECRKALLSPSFDERLDRPLAYWALPADRCLPLPFMGRALRDLLDTPPAELAATPGVGRKKMATFVELLTRAAETPPTALSSPRTDEVQAPDADDLTTRFDPTKVSEADWAGWQSSVVRAGLNRETLGRLAPSLRHMTKAIWNTPLGVYTSSTLADIRSMKTHGEKRIRAILEVFHAVDSLAGGLGEQREMVVRIAPRRIDHVERWVKNALQLNGPPEPRECFAHYVEPLLEQLRVDATPQIVALAEQRLGIDGPITSVRQAARAMHLTRARVYQLLDEIGDIMSVRWPAGQFYSDLLRNKLPLCANGEDYQQFLAAVELFFPRSRRDEVEPNDKDFEPVERSDELVEVT